MEDIQHDMQVESSTRATSEDDKPTEMNRNPQASNAVPLQSIQQLEIMNSNERPSSICQRSTSCDSVAFVSKLVLERFQSGDSTDKLLNDMFESEKVTNTSETQAWRSGHLKRQRESFILWAADDGFNSGDFDNDIDFANIFHGIYETDRNVAKLPSYGATVSDESSLDTAALPDSQTSCNNEHTKATEVESDSEEKRYITGTYTDVDVLLGRGGRVNQHPGNQDYLRKKEHLQDRYLAASKDKKKNISQELVDWIHARGGRFLKQDDEKRWYEVSNTDARKKASQTLREVNTPEHRADKRAKYDIRKLQRPNKSRQ